MLDEWMKKGGADVSKIKIELKGRNDRTLVATESFKAGDTILCVPMNLIIQS